GPAAVERRAAAHNHYLDVRRELQELRHCVEHDVDALLGYQPANVQDDVLVLSGELAAKLGAVEVILKVLRVDAVGDDLQLGRQHGKDVPNLLRHEAAAGDDAIGGVRQTELLLVDALLKLIVNAAVAAVLSGVDRCQQGQPKLVVQQDRRIANQPVVGVQQPWAPLRTDGDHGLLE